VPEAGDQLAVRVVQAIRALRALDLRKKPSIAETIDWTRTALALGAPEFDEAMVRSTLGVVLKHVADQDRAAERLGLT
jgi:MoxR-like ATPase